MIASFRARGPNERRSKAIGVALLGSLGLGTTGFAQTDELVPSRSRIRNALERPASVDFLSAGTPLLLVQPIALETPAERVQPHDITPSAQSRQASRARSGRRAQFGALKAVGAIAGMLGGFYLGGQIGAAIEGDRCRCDDPGLLGFLAGAGIGAVGGAMLGVFVASR